MVMIPFSMLQKILLQITYSFSSEESRIIVKNIHYGTQQHPAQIIPLAPRLRAFHLAHLLRRTMSSIRYRREQGGMATVSDKSHQEASEGRTDEYT